MTGTSFYPKMTRMETTRTTSNNRLIAVLAGLSWLGMVIHNSVELPDMPFYRPEYIFPSLISLFLFLGWWKQPHQRRLWARLLVGWSALHLIGGAILSVIPLPIWPFYPEQSASHYISHVIYGVAQLPLLWVLGKGIRK